MKFFGLFIQRPVATTLLFAGIVLAGGVAYFNLPVASVPEVGVPVIVVDAYMPGASPETMASSVATPLERHLGTIADVNTMYSLNRKGNTHIQLRFNLDRDVDGAARDVQAAISAARADLPVSLSGNPTYRKLDPAVNPILILTLTSDTMSQPQLYDAASTILAQSISQVDGVGEVDVGGSSLPAIRVELDPATLFKYGIGLENVRAALAAANANSPKGAVANSQFHWQISANDQMDSVSQYKNLIIAFRHGAPIRLASVAEVTDSVENIGNFAFSNGKRAVTVWISPQPRANIVDTVARIRSQLPQLEASIPGDFHLEIMGDSSVRIRASLHDVEYALGIAVILVVLVVFVFFGDGRATLIPGIALPISIVGTFGVMYLLGYSLDNFSLIALTISTGFVVDDSIVVLENTVRHMEMGVPRYRAALLGAQEVGFTVLAMSLSLIAVFSPVLLMGGLEGGLFHEFAGTLSIAILMSLLVSLTLTPAMCARMLRLPGKAAAGPVGNRSERAFRALRGTYERSLTWALRHQTLIVLILIGTIGLNVLLFSMLPKGFFPEEDTGQLAGSIQADQSSSFQHLAPKLKQAVDIIQADPAVSTVIGEAVADTSSSGQLFIGLKPRNRRNASATDVMARLRPRLALVTGVRAFLRPVQGVPNSVNLGGKSAYDYVLMADDLADLRTWTARLVQALKAEPSLLDVNSSFNDQGLESRIAINRDAASRLGLTVRQIDDTLYDAFGERQVSTIYRSMNQYHVVMVMQPRFRHDPEDLDRIYFNAATSEASGTQLSGMAAGTFTPENGDAASASGAAGDAARNISINSIAATGRGGASAGQAVSTGAAAMIALPSFMRHHVATAPLLVTHIGPFVGADISFNLAPGASLSDAVDAIKRQTNLLHLPNRVHGSLVGTGLSYQKIVGNEPLLIAAALAAIYIVLGVLYESFSHPLTILSTLPSAGVGAFIALMLFKTDLSLPAMMGLFLLIGIVKKNAIMMIDLAIALERDDALAPEAAVFRASLSRFRPIIMTTLAAMLGAAPLIIGFGSGWEFRRPLGIAIVGGLVVSQVLTLYTSPVVYLWVDRIRRRLRRRKSPSLPQQS